jgi:hypothetical protein
VLQCDHFDPIHLVVKNTIEKGITVMMEEDDTNNWQNCLRECERIDVKNYEERWNIISKIKNQNNARTIVATDTTLFSIAHTASFLFPKKTRILYLNLLAPMNEPIVVRVLPRNSGKTTNQGNLFLFFYHHQQRCRISLWRLSDLPHKVYRAYNISWYYHVDDSLDHPGIIL